MLRYTSSMRLTPSLARALSGSVFRAFRNIASAFGYFSLGATVQSSSTTVGSEGKQQQAQKLAEDAQKVMLDPALNAGVSVPWVEVVQPLTARAATAAARRSVGRVVMSHIIVAGDRALGRTPRIVIERAPMPPKANGCGETAGFSCS